MEKRLVLAIALSLLVLLSWSIIAPKPQVIDNKVVTTINPPVSVASSNLAGINSPAPASSASLPAAIIAEPVKFIQHNREIIFNAHNGTIEKIVFKDNLEHQLLLGPGFLTDQGAVFKRTQMSSESITFVHESALQRIVKKFHIPKDSYAIDLEIQIHNLTNSVQALSPQIILGRLSLDHKNPQTRYQDVLLSGKEKASHLGAGKNMDSRDIKFIGLRDQYFCAIIEPLQPATQAYIKKINPLESEVGLFTETINLPPQTQIGQLYRIYLGPQDLKTLNNINPEWTSIIYFGIFDFIAQLILQLLGFFYSLVHNWGWALIILSVAVYLLLFPLSIKQMRSMKEMQILQPKIEALRNEYKNNPQKLNAQIMELYKEHKVNPLSGCLPLILQMPIFFALYQALIRSVALRGAQFLWIKDLSSPDKLFVFNNSLPILGNQLNILPILMAIGMFVQQKISMVKSTGDTAQQQKIMMIVMPIMFGVIFYQMPSGLVLYWFVNSLLMLAYQYRINRQR